MSESLEESREQHRTESEDQAKRRHFANSSIIPKLPNDNRYDLGARTVQQQCHRQLSNGDEKDVDPAGEQSGQHQRKENFSDRLPPVAAARCGTLLEFSMNAQQSRITKANAVRKISNQKCEDDNP